MSDHPPVRLGMLTPSSNTVVEPLVAAMLAGLPEVTAHVSRLRVTEISLDDASQHQFQPDPMLAAAELLAEARVHVMGWNGTSAAWLGFDGDRSLCDVIAERFGVPATSAVLAVNEILEELEIRRFALVTPYVDDVQARIIDQYTTAGYTCIAERHTGEHVNYAFAEISEAAISDLVREVAVDQPEAVAIMCTNMRAAPLAQALEAELGITVIDSLAAYVWKSLRLAGVDTARLQGWGRLFNCHGAAG